MRVPGIGGFSPVDAVSWVRATSPSELVYRQRTRPAEGRSAPPRTTIPSAAATVEVRTHLEEAVRGLRQVGDALALDVASEDTAHLSTADETISNAYPGVRGGTITVNGHSINVRPGVTTLREVVAALDTIPGLFAAVDTVTGTIMVAGLMADKKLEITDSTGLLRALGLQTGVIVPPNAVDTKVEDAKHGIHDQVDRAAEVSNAVGRVNDAMRKLANGPRELDQVKVAASTAVAKAVQSLDGTAAQALRADSNDGVLRIAIDADGLKNAIRTDPSGLGEFLKEGLLLPLEAALDQLPEVVAEGARPSGAVGERGALSLRLPPVELLEAVLAYADGAALRKP